jgi:two-component system, OmpR family, response regulator
VSPCTRPSVLCVDDDEDSRVMLVTLLRQHLIEAKAVGTAAQAISSIQTESFDLYLLDTRLPDLDGFDLCRRIRDVDQETPILFFSGAAHSKDRKKGLDAGANAYVVKPEIDSLIEVITRFVGQTETDMAQVVPFRPKMSSYPNFADGPLAA